MLRNVYDYSLNGTVCEIRMTDYMGFHINVVQINLGLKSGKDMEGTKSYRLCHAAVREYVKKLVHK